MHPNIEATIRDTATASIEGRIHFGQVVDALQQVGVEAYQVDYRAERSTYFLPDDSTLTLDIGAAEQPIAQAFSVEGIQAAIRAAQRGKVKYPEFKHLSQAAGCIGYTVWLAGRHVSYFGRCGETHVEQFPS